VEFSTASREARRKLEKRSIWASTWVSAASSRFQKRRRFAAAARLTPLDRLLVETDAPYLAPVPHRGKRNEPSFVVETVKRLAEVVERPPELVAEQTTANFERLCLQPLSRTKYTG